MKPIVFFILVVALSFKAQSQKIARFDIVSTQSLSIYGAVHYDSLNNPSDTLYYMFGRDSRYTQIYESVSLKSGNLKDLYSLIIKCQEVLKTEPKDVSITYLGTLITTNQMMGIKYISLYSDDKYSNGHTDLNATQLSRLIYIIESSCRKKKICYK